MKILLTFFSVLYLFSCTGKTPLKTLEEQNLVFNEFSTVWDEAIPLGNGMVGNLVWQKNGKLRFSLDRADLWDLRPIEHIDFTKWKFQDVYEYWRADKYNEVLEEFDLPNNKLPAPSKIPAGGLEFDIESLGTVKSVTLDIETARCVVDWESGARLTTFVHAEKPVGWYKFENIDQPVNITLTTPAYNKENEEGYTPQSRLDLNQLGYLQGVIVEGDHNITYNQNGWGDFSYQIHTGWEEDKNSLTGCWSVSSVNEGWKKTPLASEIAAGEIVTGFEQSNNEHVRWWSDYWNRSAIEIPDSVLEKQYYLEMYKFGSAARADAPPISLQAVWTADHGKLPPWKGDFHHDLNTQLSYWPSYTGNYLHLEEGYLNWLWKYRTTFKKYTREYFEVDGLNVPGVCTLEGEPMGGWIQYSMGQGISAWLGHHFYLHWKYSMDRDFLENRAYPWIKDVAIFFDEMTVRSKDGMRKLCMSSSPEIYHNSREAWFPETTNFDLALIRWTYEKAVELAKELDLEEEAEKWAQTLSEWPELVADSETGLMFAPGYPYNESHRHFSHLMGFHPLGLIDISNGETDAELIQNTLENLAETGTDSWTGYSFSWQGNLYARAFNGEKAAEALRIFAECFCLKNSFHVNGDQCKAGYSKRTYRPFTLEGNFAFASAIQEMLMQSHTGVVKLFPAVPSAWMDISFSDLRTYGAFLVSAKLQNGSVTQVEIRAESGGEIVLQDPFKGVEFSCDKAYTKEGENLVFKLGKGESASLK